MNTKEAQIVPYHASGVPRGNVVLVFAPHPDDEVFGCGGALALHSAAGHRVKVILLTAGDRLPSGGTDSEYAQERLKESATAATILGIEPPLCWGLKDRSVGYGEALVSRVMEAIVDCAADVVYSPSLWESHPDHRAVAMAVIEGVRRLGGQRMLLLYELSAPLRPNRLLDISAVWAVKSQAMACFVSQNSNLDYPEFIGALNRYRALTLGNDVMRVEAFEAYDPLALNRPSDMPFESEHRRQIARGLLATPSDAPLVSVIVRTTDRPSLRQTLDSLISQTYTNIELVLVDVNGDGLPLVDTSGIDFLVRIASHARRLGRAAAANLGLDTATGEHCLLLDDDDWLYADHLEKLVKLADLNPAVKAFHTAVVCVDSAGNPTGTTFDFPYAPNELRYGNFMPIHAVMFRRVLVNSGCRFDSQFDIYEDWDFWLQVEKHTPFAFVPGISAAYRIDMLSGAGVRVDEVQARVATAALFVKWKTQFTEPVFHELVTRSLQRRAQQSQVRNLQNEVEKLQSDHQLVSAAATFQQARASEAQQLANAARQDAHHYKEAHDEACRDRDMARGASLFSQDEAQRARDTALRAHDEAMRLHREAMAFESAARLAREESAQLTHELGVVRAQNAASTEALVHEREISLQSLDHVRALQKRELQLRSEVQQFEDQVAFLQNATTALRSDLDAQKWVVSEMLASTSWKLTFPVRYLGKTLRRVRGVQRAIVGSGVWQSGFLFASKRLMHVMRREGLAGVTRRMAGLLRPVSVVGESDRGSPHVVGDDRSYQSWIAAFDDFDAVQIASLHDDLVRLQSQPLVSIVMPVYNTVPGHLQCAIESVQAQIYSHWELCICDDASTQPHIREMLDRYAANDSRIRVRYLSENGHISRATNAAIEMVRGTYVAFLDHDDEISRHALLRVVQAIVAKPDAQVFYSDEDKIDAAGIRFDPYFKPDFNIGLLRSHNYMCHFAVYASESLRALGGLREGFEGAQDYDLALRAFDTFGGEAIAHLPYILYHWRAASGSTAAGHTEKSYAFLAGQRALSDHIARRQLEATVEEAPEASGMYRIRWARPQNCPKVSIVIPTRNGEAILRQCLDSLRNTSYPNFETIVVDNGSDDVATLALLSERVRVGEIKVLRDEQPFNFSALNNHAVKSLASGEFVLLLNNDIEAIGSDWLDEMVGAAMEPGVGCVGARLWYPDGRLQHGGVILVCGVAGHAHKYLARGQHGYMGRAVLAQDMVAVTAACLLVRKSIYIEVCGLDEGLAVAFNDIDFCLRVHSAGYRNHWTPYAELIHHESVTRGYEDTPEKQARFRAEIEKMQDRWPQLLAHDDPCYSPNLTAVAEDFSLAWPPRRELP